MTGTMEMQLDINSAADGKWGQPVNWLVHALRPGSVLAGAEASAAGLIIWRRLLSD